MSRFVAAQLYSIPLFRKIYYRAEVKIRRHCLHIYATHNIVYFGAKRIYRQYTIQKICLLRNPLIKYSCAKMCVFCMTYPRYPLTYPHKRFFREFLMNTYPLYSLTYSRFLRLAHEFLFVLDKSRGLVYVHAHFICYAVYANKYTVLHH